MASRKVTSKKKKKNATAAKRATQKPVKRTRAAVKTAKKRATRVVSKRPAPKRPARVTPAPVKRVAKKGAAKRATAKIRAVTIAALGGHVCHIVLDEDAAADKRTDDIDGAVRNFVALEPAALQAAEEHLYRYYLDCKDDYEPGEPGFVDIPSAREVWKHIRPGATARVSREDNIVYLSLSCACDWEQEHGLQIVFKEGSRVSKVGGFDGHVTNVHAYADPSLEHVVYRARQRQAMMVSKSAPPSGSTMVDVAERAVALLGDLDRSWPRFGELAEDVGLSVEALLTRLQGITTDSTLADFFPSQDVPPHYTWSGQSTLIARLLLKAGFRLDEDVVFEGDHRVSERLFVPGNLVVKGRLKVLGATLVVIGDVQADVFEDEYASVAVGGDLTVERALYSQAFLGVAGLTKASFICLDFNQGFAKLLGGCEAIAFIESDHGGSRIFGSFKASYINIDELRADQELETSPPEALAKLLHADVREGALEKVDEFDLGSYLWTALGEGKQLFE